MEEILKDCRAGDIPQLRTLISQNPALLLHTDSPLEWRALHKCVICEYEEATDLLLEMGADPNAQTKLGETPLHLAADNTKTAIAEKLIRHNADLSKRSNDGDTPLHYAAFKGNSQLARLLLQQGTDPNIANSVLGRTPLHYAFDFNNSDVAKELLSYGGSLEVPDYSGQTPKDLAKYVPPSPDKLSMRSIIEPDAERSVSDIRVSHMPRVRPTPLYNWLVSHKLEPVYIPMVEAGYDDLAQIFTQMASSMPINEETLIRIGIVKVGLRRRLLKALVTESTPENRKDNDENSMLACCVTPRPTHSDFTQLPTLKRWLESICLGDVSDKFQDGGFDDLDSLFGLMNTPWEVDEDALIEIGITKPGHQHRILAQLKEDTLKSNASKKEGCIIM